MSKNKKNPKKNASGKPQGSNRILRNRAMSMLNLICSGLALMAAVYFWSAHKLALCIACLVCTALFLVFSSYNTRQYRRAEAEAAEKQARRQQRKQQRRQKYLNQKSKKNRK